MILIVHILNTEDIMKKYYSYIYLDSTVIDDLYPQIFGDIIEKNVTQSNEDISNMNLNANIFNVFSGNIDKNENNTLAENTKMVTSTARKAQLLINYFKTDNMYIPNIIENNTPFTESVYFVGKSTFFLRDIYNKRTGESLFIGNSPYSAYNQPKVNYLDLDDDAIIILETGDDKYIHEYQYGLYRDYLSDAIEIMMHMSNIKIRKDVRHLTSVIHQRHSFNFFVFGELIHTNDSFYKISPFAVWQ